MPETEGPNHEEELKRVAISSSRNFNELLQAVEMLGGIQGSKQFYSADELKAQIALVKEGRALAKSLTRNLGLRDKVVELLLKGPEESQ